MDFFKGDGVRLVINTDHHAHDGVRRIETKGGNNYMRETWSKSFQWRDPVHCRK